MYKIAIEKSVTKFLEKHKGEKLIELFKEKLIILSNNPYKNNLDIKALAGNEDKYRLRIGKYRFLYEIQEDIITISILSADSRGGVYK
ncbi:type II toxin-antitoxin system RelE/ParE family toxin [Candidatus Gracilibacteria bacterium 28_42_T64]|nr:type II toxin-antitoxin system RelE/ParE family toxin [Candidatus Gracilibacteria bacterium 28_42_T64]